MSVRETPSQLTMIALGALDPRRPIGSRELSYIALERGCEVSEATMGRLLADFDRKGWTEKQARAGRLLTRKGAIQLEKFRNRLHASESSSKIARELEVTSREQLVSVLEARRAIERETVRLAAERATREELRAIRDAYEAHIAACQAGGTGSDEDVQFHEKIAVASHNGFLVAALLMLRTNPNIAAAISFIRKHYTSAAISGEHDVVLRALEKRQVEEAEVAMVEHIDSVIFHVNEYWSSDADG